MGVGGQRHAPGALPRERPGTHYHQINLRSTRTVELRLMDLTMELTTLGGWTL